MILYIVFFFLLLVATLRFAPFFRLPGSSLWLLPAGFVVKVLVGCFFLYVYSYHYGVGELTADSSEFLRDSKLLNDVFYESPTAYFRFLLGLDDRALMFEYLSETTQWDASSSKWFNDARNILRIHSLIHFVSFGAVFIHLMVISVISLLGLRLITLSLLPYVKLSAAAVFLSLLLIPNVLFWSSGILKEPLILFSIGLFMYTVLGDFKPLKKIVLLILSVGALVGIKPYILLCMIPAVATYYLFREIKNIRIALVILLVAITGSLLSLLTPPMRPVVDKLSYQQFDFINIGKGGVYARADTCVYIIYGADMPYVEINRTDSTVFLKREVVGDYIQPSAKKDKKRCVIHPNETPWKMFYDGEFSGSYIEITPIAESPETLLKNIPEAIANVLLRPYPNDPPKSKLKWLSIIDGWGLLLLFVVVVVFFRRTISRKELNLIVALCVFSLLLTLLIGWTTPVIGAIVRYKIPVQLAMVFIILIVLNPKKLKNG